MITEKGKKLSPKSLAAIRRMQQNEITEALTYRTIAAGVKDEANKKTLLRLADEEQTHYEVWKTYTGEELAPQKLKVFFRMLSAKIFGFTFTVKLMEKGEENAQSAYETLEGEAPESIDIREQENEHEASLLSMLDEERLKYTGSMVLGLNDALVELTGTLAGLTLALQNTRIIALSGLITGISATLSMASSEFLSAKAEGRSDALKSCLYTGVAYLVTVVMLILPYLLFSPEHYMYALFTMLAIVVLVIFLFNYYISVAKDMVFHRRFLEMACISLGVAVVSFGIGVLVKALLGVDV